MHLQVAESPVFYHSSSLLFCEQVTSGRRACPHSGRQLYATLAHSVGQRVGGPQCYSVCYCESHCDAIMDSLMVDSKWGGGCKKKEK